jgi:hypothetical protein
MARPPIGKRAMTTAERQRRRRAKLAKVHKTEIARRLRFKRREEAAMNHVPAPSGITYWTQVTVQTPDGDMPIFSPVTKPLATCAADLEDDDVMELLRRVTDLAKQRGLL